MATVNLFAHHGDWERRRPALRASLRALDADVLTLQEVIVGDGTHHGASVASRWPIRTVHEVELHYVLVRCGDHGPTLRIVDAGLAVHEPVDGMQPSDHDGVSADLAPCAPAMTDTSAAGNPAGR